MIVLHDPFNMNFFTVSENVFQPVIAKAGFAEHWLLATSTGTASLFGTEEQADMQLTG